MGFFSNFKRGYNDNWKYEVAGKPVVCSHCGHSEFESSRVLLNTRALTFFDLDWANEEATALVCRHCGHIEWFVDPLEEIE